MRVLLCVVVLLAGCATTANYKANLDSWVGQSEDRLVAEWGPPASVYVSPNGDRILTYANSSNYHVQGVQPSYHTTKIGNSLYTQSIGGVAPHDVTLSCKTNFTIQGGKIWSWRFEGNNCVSQSQ
jgi:hypothetical protein